MAELAIDPAKHTMRAVVHVVAGDFRKGPGAIIAAEAYVVGRMEVVDQSRKPVASRSCGVKTAGDVLLVCVGGVQRISQRATSGELDVVRSVR